MFVLLGKNAFISFSFIFTEMYSKWIEWAKRRKEIFDAAATLATTIAAIKQS